MHLSLLSDTGTASAGTNESSAVRSLGRSHLDGLLRGLAFLAAIAVPLGLAIATGHTGPHDPSAGYAQTFDASR